MTAIDYGRFNRVLTRSAELAAEPGMKPSIIRVYNDVLKDSAERFRSAHGTVGQAEAAFRKENREALDALTEFDRPYRETRSVVLAFVPEANLPATLKAQPTDTDKLNAIESLIDRLDDHVAEAWAEEQAKGTFGQLAPRTVIELNEAIAANKALAEAREERAEAYGPAYERYLRFKRVVRDGLGAKSKQYKRIHVRAASAEEEPEGTPPSEGEGSAPPKTG
jgi:hypothetical protein